jgi:hypothetical protein
LNDAWTIRLWLWPCRAIASYLTFPSESTWTARALDVDDEPLRPMSSGYWATGISGKAPPSPKSSGARGRHPARLPYAGGPVRCSGSTHQLAIPK